MSTFPTSLNSFSSGDIVSSTEWNAIEKKIGIDGSAVATSLDYLIKNTSSRLGKIASLAVTDGNFLVGNGTNWSVESGDTAITSLGLSTNLADLTDDEVSQLENIGTTTISATQWGYLGALDQSLKSDQNPTFADLTLSGLTASELVATDANKKLQSLAVSTYPSLTEISYIKGLSSAVQTQLDGKQDALTFGIADTNAVRIDDADAADNDYAKFTANGLEGRSYSEVLSDLSGQAGAAFDFNSQNLTNVGDIECGAITATSYDGVAAADLPDKTANETITGVWSFKGSNWNPITIQRSKDVPGAAYFVGYKSRGSVGSETTIVSGDTLGGFQFRGYDGTSFDESARIDVVSEGTIATGQIPTKWVFKTSNSSGTLTDVML